jgi:hypothetical protein
LEKSDKDPVENEFLTADVSEDQATPKRSRNKPRIASPENQREKHCFDFVKPPWNAKNMNEDVKTMLHNLRECGNDLTKAAASIKKLHNCQQQCDILAFQKRKRKPNSCRNPQAEKTAKNKCQVHLCIKTLFASLHGRQATPRRFCCDLVWCLPAFMSRIEDKQSLP